jgi:hypothetical protein
MNRPTSSQSGRRGTLGGASGGTLSGSSSLTSSGGATIPSSTTLPAALAAAVVAPELASTAPHLHFAAMYSDVALLASEANAPPIAFEAPEIDEVPTPLAIGQFRVLKLLISIYYSTLLCIIVDDDVPVIEEPPLGVLFREHDERVRTNHSSTKTKILPLIFHCRLLKNFENKFPM